MWKLQFVDKKIILPVILCSLIPFMSLAVLANDDDDLDAAKQAIATHDYDTALILLRPLAEKGNPDARCQLGEMYEFGYGVPKSEEEALKWYKSAARRGGKTKLSIHLSFYNRPIPKDPRELKKFIAMIIRAANGGDREAQRILGNLYFQGIHITRNFSKAFYWYEKAAAKGDRGALSNLGYMYQEGTGIPQDYAKAIHYYNEAIKLGDPTGMNNLGVLYARGIGVPLNPQQAVALFQQAYDQDSFDAASNLGWMYQYGRGVPQDYAKAVQLYAKAAAHGVPAAQYNLGYMYQYGYGVRKDINKTMQHFKLAASQGYPESENALGFIYEHGEVGVPKNYQAAIKWYKKNAEEKSSSFIHWDLLEMPD